MSLIQFACEILFNYSRKVRRIIWATNKSSLPFNDVAPKRANVRSYDRKAEAVGHEEHSTLKNLGIRQNQHIGAFEIQLNFSVAYDTVRAERPVSRMGLCSMPPLRLLPLLFRLFHRLAGNHQTVTLILSAIRANASASRSIPLYGVIRPKKRIVRSDLRSPKRCFASAEVMEDCGTMSYVPKGIDRDLFLVDAEGLHQLVLHFLSMDENLIHKPILHAQR